jgi:hypothetical protein
LEESVTASDKDRGKKHQVFERSFDCKLITTEHFFLEKLNYIHNNPCSGVWNLVKNPVDYEHSSARYYIGEKSVYTIADGYSILYVRVLLLHKARRETRPGRRMVKFYAEQKCQLECGYRNARTNYLNILSCRLSNYRAKHASYRAICVIC